MTDAARCPSCRQVRRPSGIAWLPVLASLRGYRPAWLKRDISAGLAIAAVGLPSAIAYPAIAGLPPETGIYASIASVVGYALLGPSRRLIVGPDARDDDRSGRGHRHGAGGMSRRRRPPTGRRWPR